MVSPRTHPFARRTKVSLHSGGNNLGISSLGDYSFAHLSSVEGSSRELPILDLAAQSTVRKVKEQKSTVWGLQSGRRQSGRILSRATNFEHCCATIRPKDQRRSLQSGAYGLGRYRLGLPTLDLAERPPTRYTKDEQGAI